MPITAPPFVCNPRDGTVEVHAYDPVEGCRMSVDQIIRNVIAIARHPEYCPDSERRKAEYRRWVTLAYQAWNAEVRS